MNELTNNEGKTRSSRPTAFRTAAILSRTHVVTDRDKIQRVCATYAAPSMVEGDVLFISEKCVACTQKARYLHERYPSPAAWLCC